MGRLLAKRVAVRVLLALLGTSALAGCGGGDLSFYVKNDTQSSWYLEVNRTADSSDVWAVKVDPGADAFALAWSRSSSGTVTLLALDCSAVGTFHASADGAWVVDGVAGLTGRVEGHGTPFGSRTTTPGVTDTTDCGGTILA
jgi:hypothetical protein